MFQASSGVKSIFYINVAVFLIMVVFQLLGTDLTGLLACFNWQSSSFIPTQLITYQFVHGGILHILANMLALVILAPIVEDWLGTKKFYIYYLICGVMSAILHIFMVGGNVPLVGASGSIWGMVAMFAFLSPNTQLSLFLLPIGIKAKHLIPVLFAIEVFCCIFVSSDGIAHWGHVGGAITGGILYFIDKFILKNRNIV
jgi:membrane associated rhomboid family serine protease